MKTIREQKLEWHEYRPENGEQPQNNDSCIIKGRTVWLNQVREMYSTAVFLKNASPKWVIDFRGEMSVDSWASLL